MSAASNVKKIKPEPTAADQTQPKHFLSAKEILDADDIKTVDVHVPEWGGYVKLKKMSASIAIRLASDEAKLTPGEHDVLLIMQSAINEDGSPLFPDRATFDALKEKSLTAIRRLQRAVLDLNRVSEPGKA